MVVNVVTPHKWKSWWWSPINKFSQIWWYSNYEIRKFQALKVVRDQGLYNYSKCECDIEDKTQFWKKILKNK
jgi:hypothetical protein